MKKIYLLTCLMLTLVIPGVLLHAADRKFDKATVVDTEEHTKITPLRSKATDAPPPETQFAHDVSLRLGCTVYVVRYRSEIDYLPTVLTPGQTIEISPEKSVVYVKIPGNKDAKMSIIRQETLKGNDCGSGLSTQSEKL